MSHVIDTQGKLKRNIKRKLRKAQDKHGAMIEELRDEIDQLQRKRSELEDFTQSEDPLQLVQVFYLSLCSRQHLVVDVIVGLWGSKMILLLYSPDVNVSCSTDLQ